MRLKNRHRATTEAIAGLSAVSDARQRRITEEANVIRVIVANPVMIKAYQEGVPRQ
jgi:hypothetical protein